MGAYTYKYVRDLLPPYLTTDLDEYEGDPGYDGDQWAATADYITALEQELAKQYSQTGFIVDEQLLMWLKARPKSNYANAAVIRDDVACPPLIVHHLIAEVARRADCEPIEVEWYSWPQTFDTTSGPYGGAGGTTPTTLQVFAFDAPGLRLRHCAGKWLPWNGEYRQWWAH